MELYWYFVIFVFGAIIGSFLNVVIYRLHTGKSLNGRSHCMTCHKMLFWHELFPIFSYLVQRGRCRGCRSHIPSRYLVVELLTACAYVMIWHLFAGNLILLALYMILIAICVVIVVYDIRHTIIPDEGTYAIFALALMFIGYEYFLTKDLLLVFAHFGAGIGVVAFFGGLWFVSKGRWIGFGDVKLALPLGIIVGLGGVFSMVVLSFWVGAGISVMLLVCTRIIKRGKLALHFFPTPLTIKSEVPFAPFLILGFLMVQLFHADIFRITYALFFFG